MLRRSARSAALSWVVVQRGDRHRDLRVLPLDMRYACGVENSVRWRSSERVKDSQVVSAEIMSQKRKR